MFVCLVFAIQTHSVLLMVWCIYGTQGICAPFGPMHSHFHAVFHEKFPAILGVRISLWILEPPLVNPGYTSDW